MAKHHQEAWHSLQTSYGCSVYAVLHTSDGGADEKAFAVLVKCGFFEWWHCDVNLQMNIGNEE
jgi:hypothetical protein